MKTKKLRVLGISILLFFFSNIITAQDPATWTGNDDEDWNNTANWDNGIVPDDLTTVYIPSGMSNYPDLTGDYGECDILFIETDPYSGAGSILGNENLLTGNGAYVDTFITGGQWQMVSSPVFDQYADVFYWGGNPDVYLTRFDEPTNSYIYITDQLYILEDMTGYMVWFDDDQSGFFNTYSGELNYGYYSRDDLTRSAPGPDNGWNMVGNPYPSTIDWDAFNGWTKTNIDETIYIINDGLWASWSEFGGSTNGGSNYIAEGQGFFVSITDDGSTTGTLEMDDEVRVNSPEPLLKNSSEITDYVKLVASGNGRTDEVVIRFMEDATTSFDGQYDAYKKLTASTEIPQIYTQGDVKYAVNIIPAPESLPLHFLCGMDGEYSISVLEINQISEVWLEDLTTGEMTNLAEDSYGFTYKTTDDPARFLVHFSIVTSVQDKVLETVNIFAYNHKVNIQSPEFIEGEYSIYNLSGQLIATGKLSGNTQQMTIQQTGYYLISVTSNGSTITKKVFLN